MCARTQNKNTSVCFYFATWFLAGSVCSFWEEECGLDYDRATFCFTNQFITPNGATLPPPLPHEGSAGFKGLRKSFHQKMNKCAFERIPPFLPVCSFAVDRGHLLFNGSLRQYLQYFFQKLVQKMGIAVVLTHAPFSVRRGDGLGRCSDDLAEAA